MNVLVGDVRKAILSLYAPLYTPLWHLACRQWRQEGQNKSDNLVRGSTTTSTLPVVLAKEGRAELLNWIWQTRGSHTCKRGIANSLMIHAAKAGHASTVSVLCKTWGARNVDLGLLTAAQAGHEAVFRVLHTLGARHINSAMCAAAAGGHLRLMQVCREEFGAKQIHHAMAAAARGGHEEIVRFLYLEWHATDLHFAMQGAARGGHEAIVRLCYKWRGPALDIYAAMEQARRAGHEHIVQLCRQWWQNRIQAQ